ncbi:MAG: hypothetical protein QW835_02445 [Candidatus Hadarchaeum sp.]
MVSDICWKQGIGTGVKEGDKASSESERKERSIYHINDNLD